MKLQEVLPRLNSPESDGRGGYFAFCPCHADGTKRGRRSLHVQEKDGKVLFYCFAGCRYADIMRALGLDRGPGGRRIVSTYDYQDANGQLLYQVLRLEPKAFLQRRPDPSGNGWIWDMKGVKPVLYRLPELLKAPKDAPVFVCEGEKDVDNLICLGLIATTNSGGAGKWQAEFAAYFEGRNVIIIPDNDEPGRKHAEQVAQSLYGKAASIKVLHLPDLPPKGDLSDWLAAGGTKEELLRLAAEAPEWDPQGKVKPVIVQLSEVEPEEVDWLWRPYIPLGKLTIIEGDPGVGKTSFALKVAAIISRGDPFPGPDEVSKVCGSPANIIYLSAEDGLADTLRPRLDKAGADLNRVCALTGWEKINPETGDKTVGSITLTALDVIETAMKQLKPALLVIDPLQAYLGAEVDMYRANQVRPVLAGLAALAETYKCAVICIDHLAKSSHQKAIYRGLGSIDFAAAARSILVVGLHPDDENLRVVAQLKNSLAARGPSISFVINDDGFSWCGPVDIMAEALLAAPKSEEEKNALEEAVDFLRKALEEGPRPAEAISKEAQKIGISERTLERAKTRLGVKSTRCGEPGKRGGGTWYWYLDRQSDQKSIRTPSGDLKLNPQPLEKQGIEGKDLDRQLAPLIKDHQTQEIQGFQASYLDCQAYPLGGNGSENLINSQEGLSEQEKTERDQDKEPSPWEAWLKNIEVVLVSSLPEWREAIQQAKLRGRCGIDLETTSLDPLQGRIRLIQLAVPDENAVTDAAGNPVSNVGCKVFISDCFTLGQRETLEPLVELLADPDVTVVGHNLKFDLAFIRQAVGKRPEMQNLFDTMLASQLNFAGYHSLEKSEQATKHTLKEVHPHHALADLVQRHLGLALDKAEQKGDWSGELTQAQIQYAAKDAAVLLPLYQIQASLLEKNGLEKAARLEFDCLSAVVEIELAGMPFDALSARELLAEKKAAKDEVEAGLAEKARRAGFIPRSKSGFNANSYQDVLNCLKLLGHEVENTKDETLQDLVSKGCDFARNLLEYRALAKQIAFLQEWVKRQHPVDGRLHATYCQLNRHATGRFSCSSPNLQQVPSRGEDGKTLRQLFKAPPGRKLVKVDLAGIELRIMAWLSRDKTMIEAFQNDADLHLMTAAAISGKLPEEITKEERQAAKALNFGLIYGAGPTRLMQSARYEYGVEMSEAEAEKAIKTFFHTYPGIATWHERQKKLRYHPEPHHFHCHGEGYYSVNLVAVRTASGRRRVWPNDNGKTTATVTRLLNTPDQGTGADIIKLAMVKFYQILLKEGWTDVKLVATVHDELLAECPEEMAEKVASKLVEAMEAAGAEFISPVPVKAEAEIGESWG